jgi:hypothetical protein
MLRKRVFEVMEFPYFDSAFHQVFKDDGEQTKLWYFLGEDNHFCMKVQEQAGFDVYLDTRIKSPHMQGADCFPEEWKQYEGAGKWNY